jgi:hypothetical protein
MTRRKKTEIGPTGPDVEEVDLANGQRLTNELAEEIAVRAIAERTGREPAGQGQHHPCRDQQEVPFSQAAQNASRLW